LPDEASYKHILFAVEDGVATITFNRPKRLNAAPVSVAIAKRLLWEGVTETPRETMAKEKSLLAWVGKQADAAEGVRSFLERRPPEWKLSVSTDLPDWPGKDER